MIHEDYVSFGIAKLMKEKGYDWNSTFQCDEEAFVWYRDNCVEDPDYDPTVPFDTKTIKECVPHVTLQTAMKWLREVHYLAIIVDVYFPEGIVPKYAGNIWLLKSPFECYEPDDLLFATYEEASEHTIKYCLEHFDIH